MAAAARRVPSAEIENVVATLSSRQHEQRPARLLTGPERAAVLMLSLGDQYGSKIWGLLDDDDLRALSIVMSTLGNVSSDLVENLLLEFVSKLSASGALMGNYDHTELCCSNTCRRSASAASWTRSVGRPAATCGRSSRTCRKRCSPTI
jgi:flagellar motor switch protein FliG